MLQANENTNIKIAPSLYIWIITIVIFIIFVFIEKTFFRTSKYKHNEKRHLTSREAYWYNMIKSFHARKKFFNRIKVLTIGSSLTKYALCSNIDLNNFCKEQKKPGIAVLRIAENNADIENYFSLFSIMLEIKPDFLVIESSILFIQKYDLQYTPNYENPQGTKAFKTYLDMVNGWKLKKFPPPREVDKFLRSAIKKGIKVVIIKYPRSQKAQKEFPLSSHKLIKQYTKSYKIKYVEFPYSLSLNCFFDFAHLNSVGRKKFSRWFASRIYYLSRLTKEE